MISVARLDNFGFLAITGKDANKFLQGYTTCDLEDLTDSVTSMGAVCNLQGRMVTSFRTIRRQDGYLLRMDRELVGATREFLRKYIVFSKAEMTDLSDTISCYGVCGPIADAPDRRHRLHSTGNVHTLRVSAGERYEVWTDGPLPDLPATEALPLQSWWQSEIEDGIAWVTAATAGEFLPQMFDYHRLGGVDFDKGCYLGQEIVARMQYRGALKRQLHRGTASRAVAIGDALLGEGERSAGTIVAAADAAFLAVVQSKDNITPPCHLPDGATVELTPCETPAASA